jgi:mono/diheme cytochrome c family protein
MPAATEKSDPGKDIFLKYKCNSCHSMQAQGIEVKKSDDKEADAEDAEADSAAAQKDPPDLSGVGLERKADWISKYLKKQETIDGVKHRKKFRGKSDEMKTLSAWLESQKTKPAAPAMKESGTK